MEGYQKQLTDKQFELISRFFPKPRKPREIPLRKCLEAILYVLSEGCSWRKIPYEYREREEDWNTIYMAYKRWCEKGIWYQVVEYLRKEHIAHISILFLDSTSIRAHHSAAGAQKKEGDQALGRSKGGYTSKIHMIAGGPDEGILFSPHRRKRQ